MKKWEYIEQPWNVKKADIYGRQGWELVTVVPIPGNLFAVFKREVVEPQIALPMEMLNEDVVVN